MSQLSEQSLPGRIRTDEIESLIDATTDGSPWLKQGWTYSHGCWEIRPADLVPGASWELAVWRDPVALHGRQRASGFWWTRRGRAVIRLVDTIGEA